MSGVPTTAQGCVIVVRREMVMFTAVDVLSTTRDATRRRGRGVRRNMGKPGEDISTVAISLLPRRVERIGKNTSSGMACAPYQLLNVVHFAVKPATSSCFDLVYLAGIVPYLLPRFRRALRYCGVLVTCGGQCSLQHRPFYGEGPRGYEESPPRCSAIPSCIPHMQCIFLPLVLVYQSNAPSTNFSPFSVISALRCILFSLSSRKECDHENSLDNQFGSKRVESTTTNRTQHNISGQ